MTPTDPGGTIRWTHAFIDRPHERFDPAARFWTAVTGTRLSPRRGPDAEFATLLPPAPEHDPCLKIQGVAGGPGGAHLDLAVEDIESTADRAHGLGARTLHEEEDLIVLGSPAGQAFCLVPWNGETRAPDPFDGTLADQICVDVPAADHQRETAFWRALTGWRLTAGTRPEYRALNPPARLPVRLLLRRLDTPGPLTAHLDLACVDRDATRAAHEKLGADFVTEHRAWTVMRDPAGGTYCLTDRPQRLT
ncbi:VOC family protein [Streptomyces sp. BI20]|uniref:VOC family protein n=1 Tax=Streptomyces sp. BI20 TaxID=3403460 RepID=UPI003C74D8C0